ncbi:hypothetical protein ACWY4P_48315 [Streptomyces sp. LZ34]
MSQRDLLQRRLTWECTGDVLAPYRVSVGDRVLTVQVGSFPDEALYTLVVDGIPAVEFDDWPATWQRPGL